MKASSGRCDCARNFGIDGLVFLRVGDRIFSFELGRNGNVTMRFEEVFDRFSGADLKKTKARVAGLTKIAEHAFHFAVSKDDAIAGADAFAWAAQNLP